MLLPVFPFVGEADDKVEEEAGSGANAENVCGAGELYVVLGIGTGIAFSFPFVLDLDNGEGSNSFSFSLVLYVLGTSVSCFGFSFELAVVTELAYVCGLEDLREART